jgi:hypothetical protein
VGRIFDFVADRAEAHTSSRRMAQLPFYMRTGVTNTGTVIKVVAAIGNRRVSSSAW